MSTTTVQAGFTHRHTPQPTPDLSGIDLTDDRITAARQELEHARADLRINANVACDPDAPEKHRKRALRKLDDLQAARDLAAANVERAVRAAAAEGTPEAAIQYAARALA